MWETKGSGNELPTEVFVEQPLPESANKLHTNTLEAQQIPRCVECTVEQSTIKGCFCSWPATVRILTISAKESRKTYY